MPKPYHQLTNRGKVERLRRMALKALEQYDLEVTRLSLITNSFNGIFRIDTPTNEKYILRVNLPEDGHNSDTVHAEAIWLEALSRDTDLSVPHPLTTRNGELVVEAAVEGVPEPRLCTIFSWVPGTDLSKHISATNIYKLGILSAKLHRHAATFKPPQDFNIRRYDKVFPFPEPVILFDDKFRHLFPPERREYFQQAVDWTQEAIDHLVSSDEPMRVIHNDLHQWNVRVYCGILSPIDFEDLIWGWPVQDIAITLYYFYGREDYQELRTAFQRGYSSCSPWPEHYSGEIDAFIASRSVILAGFIIQDPNSEWLAQAPLFLEQHANRLVTLLKNR